MKQCTILFFLFLSVSCQKEEDKHVESHSEVESVVPVLSPKIKLSDVINAGCLNVSRLFEKIQDPMFSFPAARMTINMKLHKPRSNSRENYFAYSTFYYKGGPANKLTLFTKVIQNECKTVDLATASNKMLSYTVTEQSESHLKFELGKDIKEDLPNYLKEALLDRIQPIEYTVFYISETELKVIKKYRTIDPLCYRKMVHYEIETTERFSWAQSQDELPSQYEIDEKYLGNILLTLVEPQIITSPPILSLAEIAKINATPIQDELKLCGN